MRELVQKLDFSLTTADKEYFLSGGPKPTLIGGWQPLLKIDSHTQYLLHKLAQCPEEPPRYITISRGCAGCGTIPAN